MLGSALGGKALSLPADFFTYEYVYKNHTRHYHLEGDGSLTGGCGHQEGGGISHRCAGRQLWVQGPLAATATNLLLQPDR